MFFRLFKGPLLKRILEDSKEKVTGRTAVQLYAYAGHDSTVSNLLLTLGVWDQQIPTYNTLTLFELHEATSGQFYFKVLTKYVIFRLQVKPRPNRFCIDGLRVIKIIKKFVLLANNVH